MAPANLAGLPLNCQTTLAFTTPPVAKPHTFASQPNSFFAGGHLPHPINRGTQATAKILQNSFTYEESAP